MQTSMEKKIRMCILRPRDRIITPTVAPSTLHFRRVVRDPVRISDQPAEMLRIEEERHRTVELALPVSTMWEPGTEIKIAFLSGKKIIKDHLMEIASEWLKYANLDFVYVTRNKQSDVRITFNSKLDSTSALGTECKLYGPNEATMNFGWLNEDTTEADFRSVVLHEFGHMIGCGHEHESPKDGGIPWDKPKAYRHFMKTQGWTKEEVDEQVFSTYTRNEIRGSKLDKKSIMMYPIPDSITKGQYTVGWNTRLSKEDKRFIGKVYPF